MTITKAIELLKLLHEKHGDVEVYFDCPRCSQSFTPGKLVAVAAHIAQGHTEES